MRHTFFLVSIMLIFCNIITAQDNEPWNSDQLMEPATLASMMEQNQTENLLVVSVGPGAVVKNSVDIGPAQEQANIEKLKTYLKNVPKDKEVVIYCGCCPIGKCPNVRPAFEVVSEMGFHHAKLLNLATNSKVNWIDKGFPTNE